MFPHTEFKQLYQNYTWTLEKKLKDLLIYMYMYFKQFQTLCSEVKIYIGIVFPYISLKETHVFC